MIRAEQDVFGDDGFIQIKPVERMSAQYHSQAVYEHVCAKLEGMQETENVWIIYRSDGHTPGVLACFSAEVVANMLVFYLQGAPRPVKALRSDVNGQIDEFKEDLIRAKKPYYVFLRDGMPVEAYGPEATDKVLSVCKVTVDMQEKVIKGTFWEVRRHLAIEKAQWMWREYKRT
ncbi:hypothetical protein [Dyadobacter fanqingshengii]|uniref:Uncharacterized protein n=1 Tax=Dyadobacter fanqingshengii TaxID=2906443 RepID=A0A9X1TCK1_9BACT|nr:hypothetical protein [Dyadobacter fanqingshengii]MCF0043653.1 hypothetical protein [Dyadobacter fanqingshengii]USJ34731.1 hypothetical protein NFI81_18710 [Dyadobacter fanqingshengii]